MLECSCPSYIYSTVVLYCKCTWFLLCVASVYSCGIYNTRLCKYMIHYWQLTYHAYFIAQNNLLRRCPKIYEYRLCGTWMANVFLGDKTIYSSILLIPQIRNSPKIHGDARGREEESTMAARHHWIWMYNEYIRLALVHPPTEQVPFVYATITLWGAVWRTRLECFCCTSI
jgi:hypothetical protein